MKNKQYNKTLNVRTGKDIIHLLNSKEKPNLEMNASLFKGEIEIPLFDIWKTVLGHESFTLKDDFFQVGGNSLKAIRLVSQISRQFFISIQLSDIFLRPIFSQLADFILEQQKGELPSSAIQIQARPEHIPLSFSQERLWFIDRLEGSVQYHVPAVLGLKGKLNNEALAFAFRNIINRHEVLRTVYREREGQAFQYVQDKDKWQLVILDGSKFHQDSKGLQQYIDRLVREPFDLSKDYMLRAALVTLDEHEHVLVVTMHHIASDAWSLSIIVKEVVELYSAYQEERAARLSPLQLQYGDYAIWQRKYLPVEVLDNKIEYWKEKLQGVAPLQLPVDYSRPVAGSTRGASAGFKIDKELSAALQLLSQRQGTTLFMTLLAAFKVLLYRYSGQQDICVGTSIVNRPQQEVEDLIGFFVNTLTLRNEVNGNASFTELLQQVRITMLEAYQHQDVPFEKVVDAVVKERDSGISSLFQVMFVLNNIPDITTANLGGVQLSQKAFEHKTSKFDLTFTITEFVLELQGTVEYSTDLYKEETIVRMMDHFRELLGAIVKDPDQRIARLQILTQPEQRHLLIDMNDSRVEYPRDKSVVDIFEQQAALTPDALAVVFEHEQLSFRQLNERSNRLAHYLRAKGVQEETLVPIFMERSAEMIVGILGILKAGGAYVPIETDYPLERIKYMLEDSGARIVVSSKESASRLPDENKLDIIEIDGQWSASMQLASNMPTRPAVHHLAYVIYTSGSTGRPKGVMIEHRNLVDYVYGLKQKIQIDECRSFALVSTISTDLGNTVIYSSLLLGGSLHVFSKEGTRDAEFLQDYFTERSIDCLKIVPSHWKALSAGGRLLLPTRLLIFGGEVLQAELVESIRLSGSACRVVNHYGPTETTIGKLLHEIGLHTSYRNTIPIGKPFSNTQVYVLSKDLQLCPTGVAGELYIGGAGLARGYNNNSALTRNKFIENPFISQGGLMYRTGDLVKYLSDGNIEFIGRIDDQVKIRGYRIELGEIESVLQLSDRVSQGVVVAREDKEGNKRLVGYVIADGGFDREGIVSYLKEKLPEHMIPDLWVELENLPLTANGKVDRKALPDPDVTISLNEEYIGPRTELEFKLAAIWQEVLEVVRVGIEDDFFELGGHSLLAVRLISVIRKEMEVEVRISDIFDYPTIALLAMQLERQSDTTVLPPIKAEPHSERIPLSFSQERLWFIDRLEGSVQYHVPAVLRLKGKLNREALEYALQTIVARHEVLRTVIREEEGHTWQYIKDKDDWQLHVIDGGQYHQNPEDLQHYIQHLINTPFDLSRDYMLRAHLISLEEQEHLLVVTLHHIASDAWSKSVFVKEVAELYESYLEDRPPGLAPLEVQYADYAIWQRNFLEGEVLHKKIGYWKEKLKGVEPLQLPTDYVRPAVQSTKGAITGFSIDRELSDKLQLLSQQQGATLFMTLLATFKILLYRYSGQEDICVGSAIAGRQQKELEDLIGFFINTLALRNKVSGDALFTEILQQVKSTTLEAFENQEAPFEKVVEAIVKERDLSRNPLFQVMFILQNTPEIPELRLGNVQLSEDAFEFNASKFDLTCTITETAFGLQGSVNYCSDLYSEQTIAQLMGHYKELLSSVVKSPHQKIGKLSMLTNAEEHQLLVEFNDTQVVYPRSKTIAGLFEEQASRTPEAEAVVFENKHLTYWELNERSNQLAHYLRSKGVKEETPVAICLDRSTEMIIGILGILKAGGCYVPIDPNYPDERKNFILGDSGAVLVISSRESKSNLQTKPDIDIIELDEELSAIRAWPDGNLQTDVQPHHLAYVIYTSGSTGRPKGAMVTHNNVVSLVKGVDYVSLGKGDVLLSTGSPTFDATTFEYWGMLLNGGQLILCTENKLLDSKQLKKVIGSRKVNKMWFASSWFNQLVDTDIAVFEGLRIILVGGEKLSEHHIEKVRKTYPLLEIINGYGPTENTTFSLTYNIKEKEIRGTIPIGRPLSNRSVYVLDVHGLLVPAGVVGEICLGGSGLARGYLNLPELTAKKFIANPFSNEPGAMIYKTGDLGRWLLDGNIVYMGRMDDQVKMRGYRIELGEIETVLQQSELVSQAVVLAREDNEGNKRLIGYIVPKDGSFDREAVITYLKVKLPEYMVPVLWVALESLPITPNGKIDRKALPDPDDAELLTDQYVAPRNETEEKLANIWMELLNLKRVGVNDNFFELGGHSLLAMRVISSIGRQLEVEVAIKELFIHSTIAELAGLIQKQSKGLLLPAIEAQPRTDRIPLSFSQERLWFIDRLEGSVQYHIPAVLRLNGRPNVDALRHALQTIVNRHEVLRTVIREEGGQPWQHIKDKDGWQLQIVDGSIYVQDNKALQQCIQKLINTPFDLSIDDMLRVALITLNEHEHVLVLTMHHIAADGWSASVLVKEVVELYGSYQKDRSVQLPDLRIQYADYAIWQRKYLEGEVLDKKLGYWKEKLHEVPSLSLPTDYRRPAVQSTKGAMLGFSIDKESLTQLQMLSQQEGATLFMTLLAAFKILLYRYSGQQDICVGSAIAGRQQQEMEPLIGFFVNTLALRSEVRGDISFAGLLQQVRTTTLEAFEHQVVPFEKVVDAVVKERDMSRNPLFQVMMVLLNTPDIPVLDLGEVLLTRELFTHNTSKFDLTFTLTETSLGLQGVMEYSTDLYNEQTIARMLDHFKELLNSIVKQPQQRAGDLPMLTMEERQLLIEFNSTLVEYPEGRNIIDLFEEQVLKTPDSTAILFEEQRLSYKELNERSNQLAHYLRSRGIKEETMVPLCLERSALIMVGILGILKAGGAYVPIDPDYPEERIGYMLKETGASIAVSSKNCRFKLPAVKEIIELDGDLSIINRQPLSNLRASITSGQLAYVIYTSGSTGQPKGVMIEHGNVYSFICWCRQEFSSSRFEIVYASTSICFDLSVFEFFYPLSIGKPVRIIENGLHLGKYLSADSFVLTNSVPSVIQNLLKEKTDLSSISVMNLAGEPVPMQVQQSLDTERIEVRNLYGPTEDTTYSTVYRLRKDMPVLIGRPVSNTHIYIIGREDQLNPIGVAGEICIGGAGLARGYLNRPELTAEKFINNPFSNESRARIYKTGDLGRWLPDGNIEYLKRMDDQVKIRGYRIELGEIEALMHQSWAVSQAVVLAREDKEGNKRLVSYYTPKWEVVKAKERELYFNQVADWKELYETEYSQTEGEKSVDEEFNIIGWNNSFTGEPIEGEQMKEWLSDIVEVILSDHPEHVLEIGCGTGLIYYQLAGKVKKYIGTDFSRSSINQITQRIGKRLRDYGPTELQVCAAHEVTLSEHEQVDTIILNSVVQYFPGEDYQKGIIEKSLSLLKGQGRIIIGDVRDNRLLGLFKSRLQAKKLQESVSVKEFRWAVEQDLLKEEELCFSPEYFFRLQLLYPQITHVDIQWKKGSFLNELTKYRYTVVIYVGMEKEVFKPQWQSWTELTDKQSIIDQLHQGIEMLAFKDVPNPRLLQEKLLDEALGNKTVSTVGDLLEAMGRGDKESAEAGQLLNVARDKGYRCRLFLNEDPLKVNMLMELEPSDNFVFQEYSEKGYDTNRWYTNIPLFTDIGLLLQKDIRSLLQQRLPDYMIPSEIITLSQLPLTGNGKIDRRFLVQRPDGSAVNRLNYQAPRTEVEQKLSSIWQELLGIQRVGIHDNFFELGGHSLMAMRVLSAIRKELEVELPIKELFLYPAIAELATHLEKKNKTVIMPAIEVQPRPQHIPLSFSQERLWFIDRLDGSGQYHISAVLRLKGILDKKALTYAFQNIVNRHEVLRTVIRDEEGQAWQHIQDIDGWSLDIIENYRYIQDNEGLLRYIETLIKEPFDLSRDYMLRAQLICLENEEHLLVVTMHHIASDGWSLSIMVKEIVEYYKAYRENRVVALAPLLIQYADYSIWQRKYLQMEVLDKKIGYWKEKLHEVAPLQLPTDYPRPAVWSSRGAISRFRMGKALTEQLQQLCQQEGTTLFMTLLAAFKVLLHRYSDQRDICVGTTIAGRQHQEVERLIGFFINTLPLRSEVNEDDSFTSLLQQVKETTLEAYERQEVPFEKVVEAVVKERDMSRNPLFQVLFVLQNTPEIPELHSGELTISPEGYEHTTAQFDLICNIKETAFGLQGFVEYCIDLFSEQTIVRMMSHYKELLLSIVKQPGQKIGALSMLTKAEEHQLLEFNGALVNQPESNINIVDLFEWQALKTPQAIAVVFREEELTYGELNERSNRLAGYLRSRGVCEETLVPICLERSAEMIVGILGILKAGGAYVPIDPDYPSGRIRYMLEDTGCTIVLSGKDTASKVETAEEIIELDREGLLFSDQASGNLQTRIKPHNLAYVIYTSGSTGKPKGVMVEHKNLFNYLSNSKTRYVNHEEEGSGSFIHMAYTFDASLTGMFMPLLSGKSIVIGSKRAIDVFEDNNLCKYAPYDFIKITPSHLELLQDKIKDVNGAWLTRKLVIGGEALYLSHFDYFIDKGLDIEIINEYGPTEATVGCSIYSFRTLGSMGKIKNEISIGKRIDNVQIYILNKRNGLVPIGVVGEICIGGAGLARGYLNLPDLTSEKFISDPFGKEPGGRLYKSGDLGRWQADGNIEYLGRKDEQVKIRGYRIELGEIEGVMLQSGLVSQSVVLARDNREGGKRLVGYIVPEGLFDREVMLSYLRSRLPEYMVPAVLVELEQLPLTSNGKIDKRALPDPNEIRLESIEHTGPRNELENALVEIWEELLGLERVGIHDNFFELGGDSIIIIQVVSRARRSGYELQVADIFTYQTIAGLSVFIEKRIDKLSDASGEQLQLTGFSGLLPIQQWYLEGNPCEVSHFNQGVLLNVAKGITEGLLRGAVERLMSHHDSLRYEYQRKGGEWQQQYGSNKGALTVEDLRSSSLEGLGAVITACADGYQRRLDIEKGEVMRVVWMRTPEPEGYDRLLIVIHHLAVDGVSWRILLEDLDLLLEGMKKNEKVDLGSKSSSCRQWYAALEKYGQSSRLLGQSRYWQKIVESYEAFAVDKDYDGEVKLKDMGREVMRMGVEQTRRLIQEVPRVYHTEINDILLCALVGTLSGWSHRDKVVIGLEGHGREGVAEGVDTSRTVGWFTSLYPVLLDVGGVKGEADMIKTVKEQLRLIPDKGLGYGVLRYINEEECLQGRECWDIVFNYLGQSDNVVRESKWLSGAGESAGGMISEEYVMREKLSVNGLIKSGQLVLNWSYSTKHYGEETIRQLVSDYASHLESLIAHCVEQQRSGAVYTPSDYGLSEEMTYEELDRFLEEDNKDNIMSF